MKKIFITGCGGMLGKAMYTFFSGSGEHEVIATDRNVNEQWLKYLDVTDFKEVERQLSNFKPDFVLHLAAETDLEYCEKNPDKTFLNNYIGTENVAFVSKMIGAKMVYISTAGVFAGEKDIYTELDQPKPLMVYGQSKYQGELAVQRILDKYFIVRAGWMVGGGNKDKKFIAKILSQIKAGTKTIYGVDDKFGTPTYTKDFAKNLKRLMETDWYGLYHMVCEGAGSRYDVAKFIVDTVSPDSGIDVKKVSSDFFKNEYFAPRPRSEMLDNYKLKLRGINMMRNWKVALKDYLLNEADQIGNFFKT